MAIRCLVVITALAGLAACSTPSAPTPSAVVAVAQASSFEGVWTIKYTVAGCPGFRHCNVHMGETRTVFLHLARSGAGYEGMVEIDDHVPVAGTVAPDGSLKLTGLRPAANAEDFDVAVEGITLRPSQLAVPDEVRWTVKGPSSASFNGSGGYFGPITSVERTGPLDASPSFSGKWTGYLPIKTCEPSGAFCWPLRPNQLYGLTITLLQSGAVEGTLKFSSISVPVSGSISGNHVRLSGSTIALISGGSIAYSVEAQALLLDRVGRLTGDFDLVATFRNDNEPGTSVIRYPALPLYFVARSLR
jgi:hypothetical protein